MLTLTRRDIEDAYRSVSETQRRLRDYSGAGETAVGQLVQTLGVSAGAAAVGFASGRYGALRFADSGMLSNVPLDLAGALGLHALAYFGVAGKYGEHLHNFADGALAAYVTKYTMNYGTQMRTKVGPAAMTAGADPSRLGAGTPGAAPPRRPLTESELAAMAQNAR